jgi:hypothetical protein
MADQFIPPEARKSSGPWVPPEARKTSAPPQEKPDFGRKAAGFGLGVAEAAAPIAVGTAAAIPMAEAGGALGAFGGPAAPITVPLGALIGGGLGYFGGDIGTRYLGSKIPKPEAVKKLEKQEPGSVEAGGLAVNVPAALYGTYALGKGLYRGGKGLYDIATEPGPGTMFEKLERAVSPRLRSAEKKAGQLSGEAQTRLGEQARRQEDVAREAAGREQAAKSAQSQLSKEAAQTSERQSAAQASLDALNAQYQAMPQATPEQFGNALKKALYDFVKKYSDARKQASGFNTMLKEAGAYRRVDTKGLIDELNGIAKTRKSPQILTAINRVKSMLTNTDVVNGAPRLVTKLTVEQAHDVKMELDNMISSGQALTEGGQAVPLDNATLAILKTLKNRVTSAIASQYKPYGKALSEYAKASRPLDVVERNANIRRLTSVDPFAQEAKSQASDFVGKILGQSNKGSQILSRLIQESPELKNSARMYFTRELFGKAEGGVSAQQFRNFLFQNQGKLQAAGLLEEFSSLASARKSAEKALSDVELSPQRIESILKTAETPEQFAARSRAAVKPETAETAMTKLNKMLTSAGEDREDAQKIVNNAKMAADELRVATEENIRSVIPKVEKIYKDLADAGVISTAEYEQTLRQIADAEKTYRSADQLKKPIIYGLGLTFGASVVGGAAKVGGAF